MTDNDPAADVRVRRARIEEIRFLADEYRRESTGESRDGRPWDPPIPQGGIFWVAEPASDGDRAGEDGAMGYAAGTLRPDGMTIGPVYVRPSERREGVGFALLRAIQRWAQDTRVPVVEVSVATDNEAGRAFLESSGYVARRILFSLTPESRRPSLDTSGEPDVSSGGNEHPGQGRA